ncbi:hypothetical protein Tco_1235399 [Tanacetum coccineum]
MALTAYVDADHAGWSRTHEEVRQEVLSSSGDKLVSCIKEQYGASAISTTGLNTIAMCGALHLPSSLTYDTILYEEKQDIMADLNIPTNDTPVKQAPAVAPPTRTDDQILPLRKWVPIGKNNYVLDVHKPQGNPIFLIVVALLKNTNLFRAFTTSSTILAIYIQQFWDTLGLNYHNGLYSFQLSEQWLQSSQRILRDGSSISLQPMITIPLWLHRRVIQLSSMSTLWDTPAKTSEIYTQILWWVYSLTTTWNYAFERIWEELCGKAEDEWRQQTSLMLPRSLNPRQLSLKEQAERTQGPARPVVLREPDFGKYQPLPEVQGKGKEKVVNEQAAHDLLTLQTLMKKTHVDQFIFQRHPPMHTKPTGHADSPSLDAELPLTDSETELDEEVPMINAGDQDESQAGPNPGEQDEGQAGPNPGIKDKGQAGSNPSDAAES